MELVRQPKVTIISTHDIVNENLKRIFLGYKQCYYPESISELNNSIGAIGDSELAYLTRMINSGHESPLEHSTFTFAIEDCSTVLTHQLVRHRVSFSPSQKSLRYTNAKNFTVVAPNTIERNKGLFDRGTALLRDLQEYYNDCLDAGVPNEDARYFGLPVGITTSVLGTVNFRSLLHLFNERCCSKAQWEIRSAANDILKGFLEQYPIFNGLVGPKCVKLKYCPETHKPCGKMKTYSELLASIDKK